MKTPQRRQYLSTLEALRDAGVWGKYQIYTCLVIQYASIVWAGLYALTTFGQLYPEYECHEPGFAELTKDIIVSSHQHLCALHSCKNRTVVKPQFHSMTAEWQLVCGKEVYFNYILLASAIGKILGGVLGGHIGDWVGRKRTLYATQFGICVASTLSTACTNWVAFAVCWALTGFLFGLSESSAYTLTMEFTDSKHRWLGNACHQWILQYPICALIAWLTADWRMYLIIINLIFSPVLVFFLIFMESPTWLIYKRYLNRAADVFNDLGSNRWDHTGVHFAADQLETIPDYSHDYPKYTTPLDLVRTKCNFRLTACFMLGMFTRSLVSSLFLFRWKRPDSNPFLNVAFYGLARIWVPFAIIAADWKFVRVGRRNIFVVSMVLMIVCLIIMTTLEGTQTWSGPAKVILGLLGAALSASGVWMSLSQMIIECYPTAYRNTAFGYINTMDSVGIIAANYLVSHNLPEYVPGIILVVISVVSLIAGIVSIPETKGLPLADSLQQIPSPNTVFSRL